MKIARLIHNPTAGDEAHSKDKLIALIEKEGYVCRYSSTKKVGWDKFENDLDFIVIAGGDGTVRKVIKKLVNRKLIQKTFPIALLPLGTANNIAGTLGLHGTSAEVVGCWKYHKKKRFDIGKIYGSDSAAFFVESIGFGMFPFLMQEMKTHDKHLDDEPEKRMNTALKLMHQISSTFKPLACSLQIDGRDYSGKYLMVEIMNTKSIGPNLMLAPESDPSDGHLEVVFIPEDERENFTNYLANKMHNGKSVFDAGTIKAKTIKLKWEGKSMHVDDEVIKIEDRGSIYIELNTGLLEFLVT